MEEEFEFYKPQQPPVKWIPRPKQKIALKHLQKSFEGGLFLDPGFGKTSVTLEWLCGLFKKKLIKKVLLIAPRQVCYLVWPQQIAMWTNFNHLRWVFLHGKNKDELLQQDADIYIINPEGLDWLLRVVKTRDKKGRVTCHPDIRWVQSLGFDVLVVDELSKFKNISAQRIKSLRRVIHLFKYRKGLTGSPAANGLMGLFGQCLIIDQGRTFGQYITHFRRRYFNQGWADYIWELKPGAEKEIYAALKPRYLRLENDTQGGGTPALETNVIQVELPPKARSIYKEVEKEMYAVFEEGVVDAQTAAVVVQKCQQISSGAVYLTPEIKALVKVKSDKQKKWVEIHDQKIIALQNLIDELQGDPVLIAYHFRHDLERLQDHFSMRIFKGGPLELPYIGKNSPQQRNQKLVEKWNVGELPYLFGAPTSIGHGLNLQNAAKHVCWFTLTYDYEVYDQFNRRVRRPGCPFDTVYVHHIVAAKTIDDKIVEALSRKKNTQNALFKALQRGRKNG